MSKSRIAYASLLLGFAAATAWGQPAKTSRKSVLPTFDARDVASDQPAGGQQTQAKALVERRRAGIESYLAAQIAANPGTRIVPNRFGVPKLFLRDGKPLSAPSTGEPEQIAKGFLLTHASLFPFAVSEVDNLRLVVKDVTGGATFVAFNQTLDGIDVFEGQIKFTLSRAGEVVQTAAGEVVPGLSVSTTPRLSPEEAVRAAFAAVGVKAAGALSRAADVEGKARFLNPRGDRFNPIAAELSIFPLTATSARLAYRILLDVDAESYYEILIGAEDGSLLYRRNLYVHVGQGAVWTQSPLIGARQTVSFPPASNPFPDAWVPAVANGANGAGWVTTGNNTDAYLDATGNDQPDSVNTSTMLNGRAYSATQNFTFPFGDGTLGLDPRNYQAAAVTNLFYFVNLAHDYYYGLGFTEAAGNFQTDNYGRGGTGNDSVKAEAQFGGFTDNSDFSPTPEGTQPHLRMGIFTFGATGQTGDRDADYDGQVAFHEYGHGLSNRLVGAKVSTSCLYNMQSGAMGEGWSDYFSISFFNNPVEGAYIGWNPFAGIRRQSYEGYPYTYEDVGGGPNGYEVHDDGEIWAAALWDLRKSLGQAVTDQLVVNGLKSTPCSPSMTDARDAILAADLAANGGANRAAIWQVFAKHGMGYSALGVDGDPSAGTRYDAAYDLPPDLQTAKNPAVTSNPLAVTASLGGSYAYQVIATNPNGGALNYALTSGPAGMTVNPATGLVSWTATFTGQRVEITVTDGKGGKVVHGYLLPVLTSLNLGQQVSIGGPTGSAGYATVAVPANTPVLQVTLRGGTGDADLWVTDPDGNYSDSGRDGNAETLTFANPPAGTWQIEVDGYLAYSGVELSAAAPLLPVLGANIGLSALSGIAGSETLYRVTVPAGAERFLVTTSGGTGDVDLYLRRGQPAVCQLSDYVYESCYYDWSSENNGNADSIAVSYPAAGDWYLDLSAYATFNNVTLTMSTTAALAIGTSSPLRSGAAGVAYAQTLVATGGVSPYIWSVTSGSLPAGLTFGSAGTISGTPTAGGAYSFTVQVKDGASATATATLALTISAQLAISTSSPLLSGFTNGAYSQTLGATGGSSPYAWSVTSGALPGGLTLSGGGTLAGAPASAGTFNFTVQVLDSVSATATKAFALTVVPVAGSLARVGVLSQFAAGGSWDSTIWVTNNSSSAVPVRLVFHGDDGTQVLKTSDGTTVPVPLTITQQGDSQVQTLTTLDRVISPNTTLVVGCGLGLVPNVEGWVDVIGTAAVSGFAVFRYAPGGLAAGASGFVTPWEGTVPLQSQLSASTLTLPFDNTNGFTTGIAIGSLSTSAATITATFFDIAGNALGSPQTIPLQASGHTAFMVNPGPTNQDWSFTAGQQGIVKFTGAPMMGLGLRASPYGTLTSVPAVLQ